MILKHVAPYVAKSFDILAIDIPHNYFNSQVILIKLISDLYLAKFLDTLAKSFFLCSSRKENNSLLKK